MATVRVKRDLPALASVAEALWYDVARWPTFVDGLKHVERLEGDWPHPGARVLWDSHPGGRGRVDERVTAYEPRAGQTVTVEDETLRATQRVAFQPRDTGVRVTLELEYALKDARPHMRLVETTFVRRAQRDSLARTLRRFAIELAADARPANLAR